MRRATDETVSAVRELVDASSLSQNGWARSVGLTPADASDVLRLASVSLKRENRIRLAIGLRPLSVWTVQIDATKQVVARPGFGKKRPPRFEVTVSEEEAVLIREMAQQMEMSVSGLLRQCALDAAARWRSESEEK